MIQKSVYFNAWLQVKWDAPSATNGKIEGYYVYYRLDNSFADVAARLGVDDTTRYFFSILLFNNSNSKITAEFKM